MRGSRRPSKKRTATAISQPANQIVLTPSRRSMASLAPRERPDAQEETGEDDGEEEPDVGEEQGAGGERREVRNQRELGDDRVEGVGEQMAEGVDHPEQDADAHGDDGRYDLVRGEPGHEEPDGGEGGGQEQETEEATIDRAPVGVAVDAEDGGVAAGERKHQHRVRQAGGELGEDDLDLSDGRRQEQLERARPALLGDEPHRHHGHDQEEEHGRLEEDADELARAGEKENRREGVAHEEQIDGHRRVGDGGGEDRLFLFQEKRGEMPHARSSGWPLVRPRKRVSRSTCTGVMSSRPRPAPTTAAASASAMGPAPESTTQVASSPPGRGSTVTRCTPGTPARQVRTASSGPRTRILMRCHESPPPRARTPSRRPPSRIATRSATRSISPRIWEVTRTVRSPASARTSTRISMTCPGSSALVG